MHGNEHPFPVHLRVLPRPTFGCLAFEPVITLCNRAFAGAHPAELGNGGAGDEPSTPGRGKVWRGCGARATEAEGQALIPADAESD
ncbi:hypothetical protein, partial [Amycolatopsis sp. KNN50.9b]|uniref:hypothetical protein n=1 Tax=Amycolatopsis sp. KNN50.9b TaxID=2018303 RepID=UPI0011777A24